MKRWGASCAESKAWLAGKKWGSWRRRGCWSCEGVSRLCGSAAAACATGSAVGTMRQAQEATPSTGAVSLSLKGRRALAPLSSARPVVATAASTAGCRCMRLHGTTDPTHRRPSRDVLQAWSPPAVLQWQMPNNSSPPHVSLTTSCLVLV